MDNFKKQYNQARIELRKELQVKSIEAVPRIVKVSINIGAGAALKDSNYLEKISADLIKIVGQKPVMRKAKKSIATFKLREGSPIGVTATLRGKRMYDFLSRLVDIALPRVRDFQGIPDSAFDGSGNYTIGIKEHIVFPEIVLDNVEKTFGLAVTIVTNANSDELSKKLLTKLKFPFKNKNK
ncbi:50S ribosomal protein L5 [Patescibacteria group bacterium]|nr:50S ribosomal protein L5 [Patescibacteria group bacterium]